MSCGNPFDCELIKLFRLSEWLNSLQSDKLYNSSSLYADQVKQKFEKIFNHFPTLSSFFVLIVHRQIRPNS